MDTNYNKKVSEIDSKIRSKITEKAKDMQYKLVLPKEVVFWGGDDITSDIEKTIK